MTTDLAALTALAWIGWVFATLIVICLYGITGYIGRDIYKRLTRIYHFTVLWYWLDRLEREGTRTFQKAEKEES